MRNSLTKMWYIAYPLTTQPHIRVIPCEMSKFSEKWLLEVLQTSLKNITLKGAHEITLHTKFQLPKLIGSGDTAF